MEYILSAVRCTPRELKKGRDCSSKLSSFFQMNPVAKSLPFPVKGKTEWREAFGLRVNSSSWKPEKLGIIVIKSVDILHTSTVSSISQSPLLLDWGHVTLANGFERK